ncbi:MAG: hypothetical protein V4858_08965 [Pseudomonadota bacterium]
MSQYRTITPAKGSLRSPVTQGIVNHLQANGPTGVKAINNALAHIDGYGPNADPLRLVRVLHKLGEAGHIHRVERNSELLWVYGARPRNEHVVEAQAPDAEPTVAAARYDLMRATAYRTDPGPALRPGALDFKRVATFGLRC